MKKRIINNTIELEWGNILNTSKFEGDDVWGSNENGDICSLILTMTGKEETGSNFLKIEDSGINLSANNFTALKRKSFYTESKRQYFSDNKILFDYRVNQTAFDLSELKTKVLNDNVVAFFNNDNELEFLMLMGVFSFDFYPNSLKDEPIKLNNLNLPLKEQLWEFYIMSCLYQYDCSLSEYKNAIQKGEILLKKDGLDKSILKFIETNIEFWKEIIEDEFDGY